MQPSQKIFLTMIQPPLHQNLSYYATERGNVSITYNILSTVLGTRMQAIIVGVPDRQKIQFFKRKIFTQFLKGKKRSYISYKNISTTIRN